MFNKVKIGSLLNSIAISMVIFTTSISAEDTGIKVGNLAPDFEVITVQGDTFHLSEYKSIKPVYLIFWATWCKACKREIPHFKQLHNDYGNKIEILAVNVDSLSWWSSLTESNKRVNEYIKNHDLTYPVTLDDKEELMNLYKVQGTPTQLLIDKNGVIVYRSHMYNEKVATLIKSL